MPFQPGIDFRTFSKHGSNKRVRILELFLHFLRRIDGVVETDRMEQGVQITAAFVTREVAVGDDQEVHIAVGARLAACMRAEKDDFSCSGSHPQRRGDLLNAFF